MITQYTYYTQAQVREAFWQLAQECGANVSRRKITSYDGKGKMYNTDTRVAFVDFVESLHRNGEISDALANWVTLGA